MQARPVVQKTRRTVGRVVTLTLTDGAGNKETLTATEDHPVYVQGQGFVPAGQLGIGTSIVTRAGPALTVSGVRLMPEQVGGYPVYNLTVEGDHTYFVGSIGGGAWVHNANNCGLDIYVIGRQSDTAVAATFPGHKVLNVPNWNISINDAWIQQGIDEGADFYLATSIELRTLRSGNPTYPTTVFFRELKQLREAGYGRVGDYMKPPGAW